MEAASTMKLVQVHILYIIFLLFISLGIVDEWTAQKVPHPLGGQLSVALVHMQLPPSAAVQEKNMEVY